MRRHECDFRQMTFCWNRIQELRRDLQAVIVAKTGAVWESHGGETFLSEQIAVSILDETKQAMIRCHAVCCRNLHFMEAEIYNFCSTVIEIG